MKTSHGVSSSSLKDMEEQEDRKNMFDVVYGKKTEKIVLQRLIVISGLHHGPAERTDLGDRYEKLTIQLKKRHKWDPITGLLLIYPSCLLHVVESSGDILYSVLEDLNAVQLQPGSGAKVVFVAHNLQSRMFKQWSYKVLDDVQVVVRRLEEEDDSTELLVCSVLSALQKLHEHLETSEEVLPESVLDQIPELIPEGTVEKLLGRDELLSPSQYLQIYRSPLNISTEFGLMNSRSFISII